MMDFPTAWGIARATPPEYHHNACSFNVTDGGMLCDCDVLLKHPQYVADLSSAEANSQAGWHPHIRHGFTPGKSPFADPNQCRVMLARYACPWPKEEHDPTKPPEDLDAFGYRRPRLLRDEADQ